MKQTFQLSMLKSNKACLVDSSLVILTPIVKLISPGEQLSKTAHLHVPVVPSSNKCYCCHDIMCCINVQAGDWT